MAGLVEELVEIATDERVHINVLLRKALVVSQRLNVPDMEDWIASELAGYADKECPDYRKVIGQLKMRNPFHGWQPVHIEDQEMADAICNRHVAQSAGELADLLTDGKSGFVVRFPAAQAADIMRLTGANLEPALHIPRPSLVRVVGAVRDQVLKFALDLERRGVGGGGRISNRDEKMAGQGNQFNTTINNIQSMVGSQIQQHSSGSQTMELDIASIRSFAEKLNGAIEELRLSEESRRELEAEVATIQAQLASPKPKSGVLRACLTSTKTILEGAAGSVVATGLLAQLHQILPSLPF